MEKSRTRSFKKILIAGLISLSFIVTSMISVNAVSKTISTDRGNMQASAAGYYLSATKEKCFEYTSIMTNGNTTRLYLKSATVNYSTGAAVHSVARFGGAGRTSIHDYFYLKGYTSTKLLTYTTHEAIYTNAYTAYLAAEH